MRHGTFRTYSMANVRTGNTFYIDTQFVTDEELVVSNLVITDIVVSATGNNAVLTLGDSVSGNIILNLLELTNGVTHHFMFNTAIRFPNGIRPITLTNATASVIFKTEQG